MEALTFDTSGLVDLPRTYMGVTFDHQWSDLTPLAQGYILAMPWADMRPEYGWPVSYEGRPLGYMRGETPLEALEAARRANPSHIAGRFHVRGIGFYSIAPATLADIKRDCERFAELNHNSSDGHAGAHFWADRQAGAIPGFPPLALRFGRRGLVYLDEVA